MQHNKYDHQYYMRKALRLARWAAAMDEVPVGAIVVKNGRIIAIGLNLKEKARNSLEHAEMIALRRAAKKLGVWRLADCTLYVTLEPCPMCAGALVQARVKTLVFGAHDPKAGASRSLFQITDDPRLNHRLEIIPDVLATECGQILKDFFREKRR